MSDHVLEEHAELLEAVGYNCIALGAANLLRTQILQGRVARRAGVFYGERRACVCVQTTLWIETYLPSLGNFGLLPSTSPLSGELSRPPRLRVQKKGGGAGMIASEKFRVTTP